MPNTAFLGTGCHVPDRIVTNDELSRRTDTSDAWIRERSGIEQRRWVEAGTTSAMMARQAALSARHPRISADDLAEGRRYPRMVGREVFRHAITLMPAAVLEALETNDLRVEDMDLLIPHQANLRISDGVRKKLGLAHDRVFNNIQRYGNTTAASIPIALAEAVPKSRIDRGDLICFAAFGSGLTWGSALARW